MLILSGVPVECGACLNDKGHRKFKQAEIIEQQGCSQMIKLGLIEPAIVFECKGILQYDKDYLFGALAPQVHC